ncbi:hypothetical protein E5353_18490, partial [Bacteroides caecimuris]
KVGQKTFIIVGQSTLNFPAGDEAHNFIVVVEDNFKNSYELEFDFNNRNGKDDRTVIRVGDIKPLSR